MNFEPSSEIKKRVIQDLNEKYGKDLLKIDKCLELQNILKEKRRKIEEQLDVSKTEYPLGKSIKDGEYFLHNAADVVNRSKEVASQIRSDLNGVQEVRDEIKNYLSKLNLLQCTVQYFKVIVHIENLSQELHKEVGKKDDEKCVTLFANITEVSRNLADFCGQNLRHYLEDTIFFWHNVLKEKLSKDFDEILKAIKWPFLSSNFSLVLPFPSNIQKFQTISEYLLQIEIPSESSGPVVTTALLSNFPPLCLPINLLIQPLRKRFAYHFYGTRQTNRVDKPEWYLTQILTWIRDHKDFIEKYLQPVVDKLGLLHIDVKLEFIRGLVQIAVEKLLSDLPNLQYDDFIFSHSIDEALGFDKELRESYDYPANQPNILLVLTQGSVFKKWLAMEKKYAIEKMDLMLPPNSLDAFDPLTSDVEDLKITTCADAFITLLQTIKERYESLLQPGHKLQFLELQLQLLDDFRVRLLQLVSVEKGNIESRLPLIANSIYYVENVLLDWGNMLHYLALYYYKSQSETPRQPASPTLSDYDGSLTCDIETDTVFAQTLSLYIRMRKDLLITFTKSITDEVELKSIEYRTNSWSKMKSEKEFRSLSLTPSACPMFETLSIQLHQLQKSLQSKLFTFVWRSIASKLDDYLFKNLVLYNKFSEGGALQFKFDITRNLIPLFSQFTEKPHNYFIKLVESSILLNLSKGTALLLRETFIALEDATGVEDTRQRTLKEIGVSYFTPEMAIKIIDRKADIGVKRIVVD